MMNKKSNQTILAIETSCDETSIAILDVSGEFPNSEFNVRSHIINSQAELHAKHGGVYPDLAISEHMKNLPPVLEQALKESSLYQEKKHSNVFKNVKMKILRWRLKKLLHRETASFEKTWNIISTIKKPAIDHIAVTYGPGITPALWTGINMAKALSIAWNIPLIPTNHMKGHIWSIFAAGTNFKAYKPQFPLLVLLVSGGHTQLVLIKGFDDYELLGGTRDDAVGEAFDKAARALNLDYPGGPKIEALAKTAPAYHDIKLPRPMINTDSYDMSFSGLKTAVNLLAAKSTPDQFPAIADEFQKAVSDVLIKKTSRAIEEHSPSQLIIAGGVSANNFIRSEFEKLPEKYDIEITLPSRELTGDNALMIGIAGYIKLMTEKSLPSRHSIRAHARLPY
jgi:N6-L-threonylcarbamoyladenine synthase